MKPITKEQALDILRAERTNDNFGEAHYNADEALCGLLLHLGHADVVEVWQEVGKWYS